MAKDTDTIDVEALLDYIKRSRGFDFTGYKRASLIRRISKRMQTVKIETYSEYPACLEAHPAEFNHLFNTLLINVTAFFRDRPAWDYLASNVIPRILSSKASTESIRVWSAGCASGEEAYTIAILFAEVLRIEQFRDRVKIYATDVDEEALSQARQATYTLQELNGLSKDQIQQCFDQTENCYTFRKDLRRSVIFGRHDLIQDAPISRIDLLTCRNTLMYFNAETQARILARYHFALKDGGFLFLGKAEMLLTHSNLFTPVDLRCRIFTKVPKLKLPDRLQRMAYTESDETMSHLSSYVSLQEAAFEAAPIARIVVDSNGMLVLVNECARSLFSIAPRDLGRPLQDLEISYRPVELRSYIEQIYSNCRPIYLREIPWQRLREDPIYFDVQIAPLVDADSSMIGVCVSFIDVTHAKHLKEELEHSNQELEMAYEELQSSNEELETTNEELQSTNEELETMNEELQSTNEELQTVNDELQRRGAELNQSNAFLESILTSLQGGVVVVDLHVRVQIWNYKAEDLWGLRSEEAIGQNFLNLDIGLPVGQLRQPIRDCLSGLSTGAIEVMLNAINRRGRVIHCRVTCTPLIGVDSEIQGVILLMEERSEVDPEPS